MIKDESAEISFSKVLHWMRGGPGDRLFVNYWICGDHKRQNFPCRNMFMFCNYHSMFCLKNP